MHTFPSYLKFTINIFRKHIDFQAFSLFFRQSRHSLKSVRCACVPFKWFHTLFTNSLNWKSATVLLIKRKKVPCKCVPLQWSQTCFWKLSFSSESNHSQNGQIFQIWCKFIYYYDERKQRWEREHLSTARGVAFFSFYREVIFHKTRNY